MRHPRTSHASGAEIRVVAALHILRGNLINTGLLLAVSILVIGCGAPTKEDVLGSYTHTFGNITGKIVLMTNGVFGQEIKHSDGRVWNMTNTWTLQHLAITLDQSYHVFECDVVGEVALTSPQNVAMCTYLWEGNGISRCDGKILWKKSSLP
jgi:hypothetical protein